MNLKNIKITPYGFFCGLAIFVALGIIKNINIQLILIIFSSIFIQSNLCKHCKNEYTMASFISVLPLLLLTIKDCKELRKNLVALSFGLAIGRIGCYFAGCCTGRECENKFYSIEYKEHYMVNKHCNKDKVYVYPTIIFEIIIQFILAFLLLKNKYGIPIFGLGNIILMLLTNKWRLQKRMGNNLRNKIPYISLILFTLLSVFKCNLITNYSFDFKIKLVYVISAILFTLITSNDINFSTFKK